MTNKLRHVFLAITFLSASVMALSALEISSNKSANGESHFTTLDGARIHYVNYGKGSDALLLIHGWTMNLDSWRDQVADFAKRNRVIVIELPGHGQSDKPQVTYSMNLFARAVEAVMRDAKVSARCWWATAWERRSPGSFIASIRKRLWRLLLLMGRCGRSVTRLSWTA